MELEQISSIRKKNSKSDETGYTTILPGMHHVATLYPPPVFWC